MRLRGTSKLENKLAEVVAFVCRVQQHLLIYTALGQHVRMHGVEQKLYYITFSCNYFASEVHSADHGMSKLRLYSCTFKDFNTNDAPKELSRHNVEDRDTAKCRDRAFGYKKSRSSDLVVQLLLHRPHNLLTSRRNLHFCIVSFQPRR